MDVFFVLIVADGVYNDFAGQMTGCVDLLYVLRFTILVVV